MDTHLRFLICAILTVSQTTQGFTIPYEGLFKLDLVHYNDFHARFEETSVETPTCRYNNNSCLGGFPRLYHKIQLLLQEKPDAILLNAGDSFQGTYWYSLLKWNVTQEFMNLLPHDAHAIGNHEFDDGPAGLAPYLSALKAPVLAANMDSSNEPSLQGLYKPSIIIKRKGKKIGLIGLITQDTKTLSSPGNVIFTDPGEATKREALALIDQGVEIIILLSHCGLAVDKELARDYGEYIDIIIGGHTHSLLWNGPAPSGEAVAGPYPVFVEPSANNKHKKRYIGIIIGGHTHSLLWNGPAPSGEAVAGPYPVFVEPSANNKHKVLIVQASAFTKYMGNLSVYFDFRGNYVKWEGGPIFLDRSIAEDESIKAKLLPYAKLVHEAENVPIGETQTTLNYEHCVFGECTLGDLLVDAFNEYAKSVLKVEQDYLSFIQRGNIKASIPKGAITQGSIFELLPYNDRLETFELQGKYVLEALERSVSNAWAYQPFKGPWVLQVSGVRVEYNVTLPEGHRVTSATIASKDAKDVRNLDPNKMYQVTAPIYLADGGDGFSMFKDNRVNRRVIGRDQKIIEAYIRKNSPLNINTDGRIVIKY